jgi:predicted HNH restriction endonuclease
METIEDIREVLPKYVLNDNSKLLLENLVMGETKKENVIHDHQETFLEGSEEIYKEKKKQKRSVELRLKAIEYYKLNCYVCGCNFEEMYGDYGAGYIEIHHLNLLADSKSEQENTLNDVRVVCSNCHSVLHHQGRTPMNIDELKDFVRVRKSKLQAST